MNRDAWDGGQGVDDQWTDIVPIQSSIAAAQWRNGDRFNSLALQEFHQIDQSGLDIFNATFLSSAFWWGS